MGKLKYFLVLLLCVTVSACSEGRQSESAKPLPDTPGNRTMLAKRYLDLAPRAELMHAAADMAVKSIPEQDRKIFLAVMYSKPLEESMYRFELDKLVNNFTVGELQAMLTYYGSREGKSAQAKLGPLMMEIMTQLQQEVKKAVEAAKKQQPAPQVQAAPSAPKEQKEQKTPSSQK